MVLRVLEIQLFKLWILEKLGGKTWGTSTPFPNLHTHHTTHGWSTSTLPLYFQRATDFLTTDEC